MSEYNPIPRFRYWVQFVLPLVYDDTLSYQETLYKVVDYLNQMVATQNQIGQDLNELADELKVVQEWIDNFDTSYAEQIIADKIATMVFFGLTDCGYFVAYIPRNWDTVQFATTGLDISLEMQPEYGHLVLLY